MGNGRPIAVFDSGVGGLSVWRAIRAVLPHEPLVYLADQAHVPYGLRPAAEVRDFSTAVTHFLLDEVQAKLIVVACNTATAAALSHLRVQFPAVPFVGMEPAIKPAAQQTRSGVVGVLATAGTFASQRYASLMARYAADVTLLEDPCVGLVECIERGETDTAETKALLAQIVRPMVDRGADTLILGCTHYPFVRPLLAELVGPAVTIIDPAGAVARQTGRLLVRHRLTADHGERIPGGVRMLTTGDPVRLAAQIERLLDVHLPTAGVDRLPPGRWGATERLV